MNYQLGDIILRRPEPKDLDSLYQQKNDPEIAALLGGFTTGYSTKDMTDWLDYHRRQRDEVIWSIARSLDDICLGHVGLYNIDYRIRSAEFAILVGNRTAWGKGIGRKCTEFMLHYGFKELNLNRIHLSVLAINERAIRLYHLIGFQEEGRLEQAQYKGGNYVDVILMRILRQEYMIENNTSGNRK